ncbi:hypothetical protein U27_06954 [Candidatus Vecturithrix granuli]|uniref:Uncharacterized protein n=1 Tax=Vecturithrix granuli TaxID=1499967 RepID=A0A081C5W3_VECG1|nr:hypothetical protein U27_06954 [Candidatus Vecturithrix granuli]
MLNSQLFLQNMMEHKVLLEDLLKVKQAVDQMDLREFKLQWRRRSADYSNLASTERLKYMVMSIKVLQAKADLKRMITSIKELANHPEPQKAIYYYFRSNLWKFLDHFHYILLVDDIPDADKVECLTLLEEYAEVIAQEEELKESCVNRLHKLLEQSQLLEQDVFGDSLKNEDSRVYHQLAQRIVQLIHKLEPPTPGEDIELSDQISAGVQALIRKYVTFSVSRISIETSGVLSIIQLLLDHPVSELEAHRQQLHSALNMLDQKALYDLSMRQMRNQCAYALIVLLEILKMHHGLPILLLRLLELGSFIQFPPKDISLNKELRELKGKIADITQYKLRPIIEDVLWKNPTFLAKIPYIRAICPWCYRKDHKEMLNIAQMRKIVTASFERLEAIPGIQEQADAVSKSHLSELVIDILGLLVNLEPSPRFLKAHAQEAQQIKQAKRTEIPHSKPFEMLLEQQYTTYKNHLQFLEDSIEYYVGISEKLGDRSNGHRK